MVKIKSPRNTGFIIKWQGLALSLAIVVISFQIFFYEDCKSGIEICWSLDEEKHFLVWVPGIVVGFCDYV